MIEILRKLRIAVGPGFQFGREHATACPKCQHLRQKHRHAKPLSVKLTHEGLFYNCWHCGWRGFEPNDRRTTREIARSAGFRHRGAGRPRRRVKLPAWS